MSHKKKQARQKAVTAIREIIKASQDLTSAEEVLLGYSKQLKGKRQNSTRGQTILGGCR